MSKRSCLTDDDSSSSASSTSKKRLVSVATVDKWVVDHDKTLNTATWLTYEKVDRHHVTLFRCSQFVNGSRRELKTLETSAQHSLMAQVTYGHRAFVHVQSFHMLQSHMSLLLLYIMLLPNISVLCIVR